MKKIIMPIMLGLVGLSLFSCTNKKIDNDNNQNQEQENNNDTNKEIYLYTDKSNLVNVSYAISGGTPTFTKLKTYRNVKENDVPYVEIEEFISCFSVYNATLEKKGNVYNYVSNKGVVISTIDPQNDILTLYRPDESITMPNGNNGIQPDFFITGNVVKGSIKSNAKGKYSPKVIDIKEYGFDYIEQDGKCYAPIHLVSKSFFAGQAIEVVYNGLDFFVNTSISDHIYGGYQSFYANVDKFLVDDRHEAIKQNPKSDEAYRYAYKDENQYKIISLKKDGNGELLIDSAPDGIGQRYVSDDMYITYEWNEDEDGIYINPNNNSLDPEKTVNNNLNDVFKLPKKETYYGTKTRTKETADYNYNYLRFLFDNIYGLQKYVIKKPLDEFAKEKEVYDGLHSLNSIEYDDALLKLTMTYIDDCHTKFLHKSVYTGFVDEDIAEIREQYYGPRRENLRVLHEEYIEKRTNVMRLIDPKYEDVENQVGVFMEGNTAVIRFDEFVHDAFTIIHQDVAEDLTATEAMKKSSPKGFDVSMREIKKNSNIQNVVIDLTCNGGGAVLTVPYLAAFFTDDPKLCAYYNFLEVGLEFHYEVDLNRDGVYNENDTYKYDYNWYILTSDYSFSCGNLLPTIAKYSGVTIIGKQSAGGACPVYMYMDASGSTFNSSTNVMLGTFEQGPLQTFKNNDEGVPVDYELDENSWYDLSLLNDFINNLDN